MRAPYQAGAGGIGNPLDERPDMLRARRDYTELRHVAPDRIDQRDTLAR
jgi:hypothetical protein